MENNISCYKCGTNEDLSLKRTLKSGNMLFICRPCRRAAYHLNKHNAPKKKEDMWRKAEDAKEWAVMAKEKHRLLALKYKDESFMRAKGLI